MILLALTLEWKRVFERAKKGKKAYYDCFGVLKLAREPANMLGSNVYEQPIEVFSVSFSRILAGIEPSKDTCNQDSVITRCR